MSSLTAPVKAIFLGLAGNWALKRTLTSNLPDFPSGTFDGNASFSPAENAKSWLYHEQGTLITDRGVQLNADRKYIYRLVDDKLSVWFVKDEDQPDHLYHELEFDSNEETDRWVARADHLCDRDMYWAYYDFRLASDLTLHRWGLKHRVQGPDKDYATNSVYTRVT